MEEFDEKENSQTNEVEGTSENNPSNPDTGDENGDNSKTPTVDELLEKNKQLWARLQKAEKKAKEANGEETVPTDQPSQLDPIELARAVKELSQYSPEELDYIKLISSAKGVSPQEAVKSEEVQLYIQARREKVEKESKNLNPSSRQPSSEKPVSELSIEEAQNLPDEEKVKYFVEKGILPKEYLQK